MKKTVKPFLLKVHRILGLVSGAIVLVVALTGCLWAFEEDLREWTQRKYYYVTPRQAEKASLDVIGKKVKAAFPKEKITQYRLRSAPGATVFAYTKSEKVISADPYTGEIVAVRTTFSDPLAFLLKIHRTLLLGETGKIIIEYNCLVFFILVLTGLILWWPDNRRFVKDLFRIKWSAKPARRNYDLHKVGGFYVSLILLVIAWTGLYFSFDWAKNFTYFITGSRKPVEKKWKSDYQPGIQPMTLDEALELAKPYGTYTWAIVPIPADSLAPVKITLRYPYKWVRKQNVLQYDAYSRELLQADLYQNYNAGDNMRMANFDLHTGRFFGWPGKILFFLTGLITATLPVTGFLIWRKRRKKKARKRVAVGAEG